MRPRCWLPRRSWWLEHNHSRDPFNFFQHSFPRFSQTEIHIECCAVLRDFVGYSGCPGLTRWLRSFAPFGAGLPQMQCSPFLKQFRVFLKQFRVHITLQSLASCQTVRFPRLFSTRAPACRAGPSLPETRCR